MYWMMGPWEQVTAGADEVEVGVAGAATTKVAARVTRERIEVRILVVDGENLVSD